MMSSWEFMMGKMILGIRRRVAEKLFGDRRGKNGTPVAPLALEGRRWLVLMVAAAVLGGVAVFLWAQADIDRWILAGHSPARENELLASGFKSVSGYGMSFIVLVVLAYLVLALRRGQLRGGHMVYLLTIMSYGIGGITGDALKEVFDRPRPFVTYADQIRPLSHPPSPSLPSGHATKSMALALPFVIFMSNRRWWSQLMKGVALSAALAVGYARIFMGVHYVSDVLASIAVAIACLPLAVWVTNQIGRRITVERLDALVRLWGAILFVLMLYLLALS
jgi:undecaprenyl-diphosphatase